MDKSKKSTSTKQSNAASASAASANSSTSQSNSSASSSSDGTKLVDEVSSVKTVPLNKLKVLKRRKYGIIMTGPRSQTKASGALIAEIKRLQRSGKLTLPRAPFARLIKEISQQHGTYLFQSLALEALQEATELFMVGYLADSYRLTRHRKKETLAPQDMQLLYSLIVDLTQSLK